MIRTMPLWMLLAVWFIQRRSLQCRIPLTQSYRMMRLLDDIYYSLPLPTGKIETWIVTKIVIWINSEHEKINTFLKLNTHLVETSKN